MRHIRSLTDCCANNLYITISPLFMQFELLNLGDMCMIYSSPNFTITFSLNASGNLLSILIDWLSYLCCMIECANTFREKQ